MPGFTLPTRRRVRARLAAIGAATVLLAGCSVLGAAPDPVPDAAGRKPVRVAVMPLLDLAPLRIGVGRGTFQAEGINVSYIQAASGQRAIEMLLGGDADIAFASDFAAILAHAKGASDLRIVSEAAYAGPKLLSLVVRGDSPIQTIADLPGKKIAINASHGLADILTKSVLEDHGIDYQSIKMPEAKFPDIAALLATHQVDAAFLTEPFLTLALTTVGAREIVDLATAANEALPVSCYVTTQQWAAGHPGEIAAFRKALKTSAILATQDRALVEHDAVETAKLQPDTAALLRLPRYRSEPVPLALQRVADLLTRYHELSGHVDVQPMILPPS